MMIRALGLFFLCSLLGLFIRSFRTDKKTKGQNDVKLHNFFDKIFFFRDN